MKINNLNNLPELFLSQYKKQKIYYGSGKKVIKLRRIISKYYQNMSKLERKKLFD